jgi:predicted HTH transcriptional regulator
MSNRIDTIISNFVTELRTALREESAAAVASVLEGVGSSSNAAPSMKGRKAEPAPKRAAQKGGRRSADDITEQAKAIATFLRKNPNSSAPQIAEGTNLTSADLALPIGKLKEDKMLKITGERRATRYSLR